MAEKQDKTKTDPKAADRSGTKPAERSEGSRRSSIAIGVRSVRVRIAQLVWFVCALFALLLALGALTYALQANTDNSLVEFVREWAGRVDLGIFSMDNGIKEFGGKNAEVKNALFNWGIGAVVWLVIGRVLDRVIRP